jgi:formate-dependent nitrite reductase membrane component NrfD
MNLDTDLILVIGIVVIALALPSLLAAYSESRTPRFGAVLVLIGGVLIAVALTRHGPGYRFADIPNIFVQVVGRYLN